MPLNATQFSPTPLNVSADEVAPAPDNQTKERVGNAPSVSPPAPPMRATDMPPVAAAGVMLAKVVLSIAGGSILILMAYLVWMDGSIADNVAGAYKQVLNPSRVGSEFYTLDRLAQLASDLNAARDNPKQVLSKESGQKDQEVIGMLGELPSLGSTQKAQLNQCVPLPTDSSRNEKLGQCIALVDNVRQSALSAAASTSTAQMAAEAAGKIQDQRQSLHQFWIQAAQLLLLNLLLPLLTALFGYIFGTQQGSGRTSS
jgi:hypothetical protein